MIKHKDLVVLSYFRKNARVKFTEISKETKLPITTVFDSYQRLKTEFIEKHVSLINFSKLGYSFKYIYFIEGASINMIRFLKSNCSVNSLLLLNKNNIMFEVIFKEINENSSFKKIIENFSPVQIKHNLILEEIKRESTPIIP